MIAVIDYDAGNIKSVHNAISKLGEKAEITGDPEVIRRADRVILPGVGAFGDAMNRLRQAGLTEVIREVVQAGVPFLGICLGLQLLFEESEESPGVRGLGLLPGRILRLPEGDGRKIPQIGWNDLRLTGRGSLFSNFSEGEPLYVYFVHSYYLQAANPDIVTAVCDYGAEVHAAVERDNLFACQFHPEKSGAVGERILRKFVNL